MDESTIKRLNQLNDDFYKIVAPEFATTRQHAWSGWKELLPIIQANWPVQRHLKIADIGCGNGRFGEFLHQELQNEPEYIGLDNNQYLLDAAQKNLTPLFKKKALQLTKVDILRELPFQNQDLICAFGVLHHIPSLKLRTEWLKNLADKLKPDGLLIITAWQFDELTNAIKRAKKPQDLGLKADDLEPKDYFLTWERGETAVRYCHLTKEEELNQLIKSTGLTLVKIFRADGQNNKVNQYVVLKK